MWMPRFRKVSAQMPALPIPRHAELIQLEFDAAVQAALQSLPVEREDDLIRAMLRQFALYAQGLPDAQGQQTLWEYALTEVKKVLTASKPPATAGLSLVDWQTGLLSHTVLEQLAESLAVWRIELLDKDGDTLGEWIPTTGLMTTIQNAVFYRVYRPRVRFDTNSPAVNPARMAALLAPQVLPPAGLDLMIRLWPHHTAHAHAAHSHEPTQQRTRTAGNGNQKTSILAAALQTSLCDYVNDLIQRDELNHLKGSGWVYEKALYLIGKEAAEALRQHPALADWKSPFHKNTVLYRALLAQRITERCGDKPVWNLIVKQEGEMRKVAAIKIVLTDQWRTRLEPMALFRGTLDVPNSRATAARPAFPSKPAAATRPTQRTDRPDYATLFNERSS